MNKVKLGDIGKFARGKSKYRPRNAQILYEGGGFPLVQTADIKNALLHINTHSQEYNSIGLKQSKLWGKGTLAITIAANIAETAILSYPMCFPDSVVGFIADKNKTSELFVHYLLSNIRRNIQSNVQGSGTSQDNINLEYLENFEVEIPNLQYQSVICEILSSLDDKIELNNKINKELESLAKTIYEYWFVQNADKKWEKKKIIELINNQKNGDWGRETKQGNYNEKVICIRGTDINSLIGNNELKAPERYILEKNNDIFLTDGDFVIEISGGSPTQSTGRIAYILEELLKGFKTPLICSNFCKAISLKDKKYFYYFIFFWKQLYDNGLFFSYEGKTSGIKNFLFNDFVNFYKITVPSTQILNKFNKTVSPIFSTIIKNRQESACLAQLRDFLLPLLMNGQVKVKNG